MKAFLIGVLSIAITVVGCAHEEVEAGNEQPRYIKTEQDYDISWTNLKTVVDTDTGVEYMIAEFGGSKGGVAITPLYNADGTLKTVEGKVVTSYE